MKRFLDVAQWFYDMRTTLYQAMDEHASKGEYRDHQVAKEQDLATSLSDIVVQVPSTVSTK